jgi:hypothetical protein
MVDATEIDNYNRDKMEGTPIIRPALVG